MIVTDATFTILIIERLSNPRAVEAEQREGLASFTIENEDLWSLAVMVSTPAGSGMYRVELLDDNDVLVAASDTTPWHVGDFALHARFQINIDHFAFRLQFEPFEAESVGMADAQAATDARSRASLAAARAAEPEAFGAPVEPEPVTDVTDERPACAEHPSAAVLNVKVPDVGRFWVCLACGAKLGRAPERSDDAEEIIVGAEDIGADVTLDAAYGDALARAEASYVEMKTNEEAEESGDDGKPDERTSAPPDDDEVPF